ncbi:glycosyltransferase [Kribbella sp. NPDC055071]
MVLVSVLVPTVGRDLSGVLTALAEQDEPPAFELIVCVDGASAVRRGPLHPRCARLLVVELGTRQGVSVARNRAVAEAEGTFLGFLDDDTEPAPDWLRQLVLSLSGPAVAVAGRIEERGDGVLNRLRALAFEHRHATNPATVDYLNGGNCGFRADTFRALGGFDPTFPKSQDRDLARRTVLAGHTIVYNPNLVITHAGHYTLRGLWRGRHQAGRAAQRVQTLSGPTSVGPTTLRTTYGATVRTLARHHGLPLALAAATSVAAHHLGRLRQLIAQRGRRGGSC